LNPLIHLNGGIVNNKYFFLVTKGAKAQLKNYRAIRRGESYTPTIIGKNLDQLLRKMIINYGVCGRYTTYVGHNIYTSICFLIDMNNLTFHE
jgi:hypothetical protein